MLQAFNLVEKFRQSGRRVTPQRIAIFKALEGNVTHPTAEDLYQSLLKEHPTMTLATVYQTLKILRDDGVIQEMNLGGDRRHYDPDTSSHSHAVCTSCGSVADVKDLPQMNVPVPAGEGDDFEYAGYRIIYYGLCARCQPH
jgi:Fur family peroxide stress response transcriptional regulator